jgi:DNA-directed RNA polymerase subunit RPC12/RpoP
MTEIETPRRRLPINCSKCGQLIAIRLANGTIVSMTWRVFEDKDRVRIECPRCGRRVTVKAASQPPD